MESRIVELETRLAFQDESINALTQALRDQQKEIDEMKLVIERLGQRLKALSPSPLEEDGQEPPPPHY
jgi:SlyX protein